VEEPVQQIGVGILAVQERGNCHAGNRVEEQNPKAGD
jgi:hypothetical protein